MSKMTKMDVLNALVKAVLLEDSSIFLKLNSILWLIFMRYFNYNLNIKKVTL